MTNNSRIINDALKRSGLSKSAFASKLGVSRRSLNRYIQGQVKKDISSIADAARVTAYGESHSRAATERYRERIGDKRRGDFVQIGRGSGSKRFYGTEAKRINSLYDKVNKIRTSEGLDTIKSTGYFGKVENLEKNLSKQLDVNYIREVRERGVDSGKSGLLAFGDRIAGRSGWADNVRVGDKSLSDVLSDMSSDDFNRMWDKYGDKLTTRFFAVSSSESQVDERDYARFLVEAVSSVS